MQPTTERPHVPAAPRRPRGDEANLYRRHHRELVHAVSRAVNASPELIEDACQNAWAILLRRQPERQRIAAWLFVVAVHDAYRLLRVERRHAHVEDLATGGPWETVIADRMSLDDRLEALEALRILADLPARQRRDLALLVAGFSYREIAEMTGGRTYTNVNNHLAKARARVRLARLAGTAGRPTG